MKNDDKRIKLNLDPTLYALSNVSLNWNKHSFDFLMVSGKQARQFRATPEHAKRIYLLLEKQIKDYQEKHGEIEATLPKKNKNTKESKIGFGK